MRVLVCPSAFPGLTPQQAAEAIAAGWADRAPHDDITTVPLGDASCGFVDAVGRARPSVTVATTVSDPLGREIPATVLLVDEDGARTAYLEASQVVGPHLLTGSDRNPAVTSTYGVGQLMKVALAEGAAKIVVAVGDTVTNDAGAGLLAAFGAGLETDLATGGQALESLAPDALGELPSVVARLRGVDLVLATDDLTPLLGLGGTSAVTAERNGASPADAQRLERAVAHLARIVQDTLPTSTDLLTGLPRRLDREPGAGSGGGLGFGLLALGARRVSAAREIMRIWDLPALVAATDLVVAATGRFDYRELRDSVTTMLTELAAAHAVPTIMIAGEVEVGRRETMAVGLAGCYAVSETSRDKMEALADPVGRLRGRVARVATTWSPPPRG